MLSPKSNFAGRVEPKSYPFVEYGEPPPTGQAAALLALSHTPVEHRLYDIMRRETLASGGLAGAFSVRRLMLLTGLTGYGTVRRALQGLAHKLSIEREIASDVARAEAQGFVYRVFSPAEIFARRSEMGLVIVPWDAQPPRRNGAFALAIERVVGERGLSRREAHVALCCAEGLTNAEIGTRLRVSDQTIKFHLRNIFVKFGVRRRAELVSRLLVQPSSQQNPGGT